MIKPCRGYVLVEQIDDTETTSSGFVLPETAKDKPFKGLVVESGKPNLEYVKLLIEISTSDSLGITKDEIVSSTLKSGDKIIYKKWSTTDFEEDGKKLAFVKHEDILGRYEDGSE